MKKVYLVQTEGMFEEDSFVREMEVKASSGEMEFILEWLMDGQRVAITYHEGNGADVPSHYRLLFYPGVLYVAEAREIMNAKILNVWWEGFEVVSVD